MCGANHHGYISTEASMTKSTLQKQPPLPLIDNPSAPDLFADEAVGFFVVNNTMRITFASARADHTTSSGTKTRVVTGRLVIPIAAADRLQKMLTTIIDNMKSRNQATNIGTHTVQ
jgi:hypothetical protein